jgi:hypothetical protein
MEYWVLYAILIACAVVAFIVCYKLFGLNKIKQWLLWAVTEAEKEFGSGTGQLKLAKVYDMFVTRFPKLQVIVPFSLFSKLVDEALEIMENMLKNDKIKAVVEQKTNSVVEAITALYKAGEDDGK